MKKLARGLAAGVALAAVTLTGCSQPPTAAAVVEGVRVSDSTVRQTAPALVAAGLTGAESASSDATRGLVLGEASRQIAALEDVPVSDGEVAQMQANVQELAAAAATDGGAEWANGWAYTQVVLMKLGEEKYLNDLAALDIEVNPHYGTWDAANVAIVSSSLAVDIES